MLESSTILPQKEPMDVPSYLFFDKNRTDGKPYYVYMATGANKLSASTTERLETISQRGLSRPITVIGGGSLTASWAQ